MTGDLAVEDVRRWIGEVGPTGLDRPVSSLVIATYALLADRAWVHHGVVVDAPDLDRIGPGYALRAQELPTADEFVAARERAAGLFGIRVPDVLFARNVRALADQTRAKVREFEPAVYALWRALQKHAGDLGLREPGPRVVTAQVAADLLARLSATRDDPALVRILAAGVGRPPDAVLGTAIVTAPAVLDALDGVEWSLLDSVRALVGHEVVGERGGAARHRGRRGGPLRPVHARPDPRSRRRPRQGCRARVRGGPVGGRRPPRSDTGSHPEPRLVTPPVGATPAAVTTAASAATATAAGTAGTAGTVQRRVVDAGDLDGVVDGSLASTLAATRPAGSRLPGGRSSPATARADRRGRPRAGHPDGRGDRRR